MADIIKQGKKETKDYTKLGKQEDEDVLLTVTTKEEEKYRDKWYLDLGCPSHGKKYWFINISKSMNNKAKFTNDSSLAAEGIGDALIMNKNGKQLLNSNVLYISGMKSNLLSIDQLTGKNYKVLIK